ncbi:hypothetical protein CHS0354_027652 [Potamilus streckersoni]|uniref:HAUS augmin-like complex subunit 3 N-terminal domain-containing protein n=1 Tax=Potamilus streckersoni TaxID=2493646 RepID=A0AAE0T0J9_9BIVA|nr:hypothetical protein CHS0354_027652 [Potamilus streckersoni]
MKGKQLVQTLLQLGHPKADSLDSQGLDWMFENEALSPFLEWFCCNVNKANILDPKDLQVFKTLEQSGEGILEGRQLEEALRNVASAEDKNVTEEDLRSEIDQLTKDLQRLRRRKQVLMQRRNKLNLHHTALSHRLSRMSNVETKAKQQYKKSLEQSQTDNKQFNNGLEQLMYTVGNLNSLYQKSQTSAVPDETGSQTKYISGQTGSQGMAMFLSHVPLQDYCSMEEKFSLELTAFTKKQFFEGIASVVGHEDSSQYEILEVSDPESLLVRGEKEEANLRKCKELSRLQALYPKCESERIDAMCRMKQTKASLQAHEDSLSKLKSGTFPTDINYLRARLQESQNGLQSVTRDLVRLAENEVPHLILDSKSSQVLRILTGDYNLKLARQEYFTNNQDQVIGHLVQQRSRNEFLTMAYEVESRNHREINHLLTVVHQTLEVQLEAFKKRLNTMGDSTLTPARHQRGTIDSRDKSTARLYQLMDESQQGGEKQLFLTYTGLMENAEKLQSRFLSLQNNLVDVTSKQEDRITLIEKNLESCEDMVYAGSSTTSGQPLLTPRAILDSMNQLQDMFSKLEQAIKDIIKDVDNKKKILKNDKLLAKQRMLYIYFFTNPSKLNKTFEEISSRLQAQNVH